MAEVIGIVAASAQFAELLAKVAVRSAKLVSDLKHAPEEVEKKAQSLTDFQALYDSVRGVLDQHAASLEGVSIEQEDLDHVLTLIVRADEESASLEALIDRLKPNANDKRFDTWRKAAKTLRNRSDIVAKLDTLRDVKTQIDSFFSRSTFSHLVQHSAKVDTALVTLTKEQAQGTRTLSQIEKRQVTDGHTLVSIKRSVTAVGTSQQDFSIENRKMHRDLQAGIISLHQQSVGVEEAVVRSSSGMMDHVDRRFDQIHVALASLKPLEELVKSPDHETTVHSKQETGSPPRWLAASGPPITGLSSICPCQRKGTKETILTIGPVSVVRRQTGKHFPACPFSEHSNPSNIETHMSPELSDTFRKNLTRSKLWYAATATSFLRGALHLPRMVDQYDPNAPGFKHFDQARWLLQYSFRDERAIFPGQCLQVLTNLYESLAYDFNTKRDWANIQGFHGYTLLHALTDLLEGLHHVDDTMSYILDKIIRLLVDGGTPADAVGRDSLNAFDQLLERPAYFTNVGGFVQEQGHTTVMQVFRRHSFSTFAFDVSSPASYGFSSILSFHLLPDIAIEHGCSRITYSVVTKDKDCLQQLLRTGHSSNGNPEDAHPPPLCFAYSWPTGARILLEANANPEAGVVIALRYELPDFLETLLQYDMWLNEPRRAFRGNKAMEAIWAWFSQRRAVCTLAESALFKTGLVSTETTCSIIRATANARSELMSLATHRLSASQLQDLGWTPGNYTGCLVESAAMATYEKLQSMGVELKKRHFPGPGVNLYDTGKLNLEMADFLWDCGFRELDISETNGRTPLLRHAPTMDHTGRLTPGMSDVFLWFLDHGASKSTYPELNHTTILHKISAVLGSLLVRYLDGVYGRHSTTASDSTSDTYDADEIAVVLQGLPEIWQHTTVAPLLLSRDHCDCSCSGGVGCSPITSFAKSARSWHKQRGCNAGTSCRANRDILFLWKRYGPRMGYAGCTDFMDLCRVELFERLGMRHTCCCFGRRYERPEGYESSCYVGFSVYYCFQPSEAAEFREEDRFFRQKLEALMALYEELSAQYDGGGYVCDEDWEKGSFKAFWDTWWKVLQEYLPEKDSLEDSSELLWKRDEVSVEASVKLATDEMVGGIRRHVQRSMDLDGF